MRLVISRAQLLLLAAALFSHGTLSEASTEAVASVATTTSSTGGGTNPALQLVGYVKDSVVRTVDGSKEMWSNHGRCKDIRVKQKDYRDKLKLQWELQEKGLTAQEMRKKLQTVNGGITYDEYIFLSKGKEDRGRLMNIVFLMWGAPKLFPYAMMFYPDMLPGPFAPMPDASGKETKLEKLSRQRAHAVVETLINLEKEARKVPALGKLNIFGGKKQKRTMAMMDDLGRKAGVIMTTPGANGGMGAKLILNTLDSILYKQDELTRAEKRLVQVPKAVITGLLNAINGPTPFTNFMPNFMGRGNVISHVQKLAEADIFLVNEEVDLDTLSTARLLEACNDRLIGGPGRTDEELKKGLADWLDLAVVQPNNRTKRSGEHFNEYLARAALMGYYSVDTARDFRSTSYLPRLLFKGQQ